VKSSDRTILFGLVLVGLLAAFWFLILSPKRAEITDLDDQIATLQASVSEQQQLAAAGEQSKGRYRQDYHDLVVLGKAVPSDGDAGSLFVQLNAIAGRSDVAFDSIVLTNSGADASPPPAALTQADNATSPDGTSSDGATLPAEPTPVAATESAAAGIPIGAAVGPAGLPTMPYELKLAGDFFGLADFLDGVDGLVHGVSGVVGVAKRPVVDGRLITLDGFNLAVNPDDPTALDASLAVTTYVTPADQGATGGATATAPSTTVTSAPITSTPTPAPAAVATP
jgi:Tfp pilus assembly protein PilO